MGDRSVLVLSDPHLTVGGAGAAAARERLVAALDALTADPGRRADALVLAGDLGDAGERAVYEDVRELAGAAAARLGAELVVLAGNHDDVGELSLTLLGGGPLDRVVDVGGLRLVVLDTVVPGADHGELAPEQLAWLSDVLAGPPAPDGTLLLVHHPPLPAALPVLDDLTLRGAEALADVLRGSDVGLVVAGHFHSSMAGAVAGIPVVVCPSLAEELHPLTGEPLLDPGALRVDRVGGRWVAAAFPT